MREKINDDLKTAMKAGDKDRVGTLRLVNAAIKSADIDARPSGKDKVSDADILTVMAKMIKQRRDSISQFQAANRQDLVDVETFELNLLSGYLPKQLGDAEIAQEVSAAIAQTGAKGAPDMGKVMGVLKSKLAGRADLGKVSAMVKAKLAG
ncbi:MAG TPA: GatB/YqeY domain-containing protein [Burkholderiales bacterium]|nr:GatB/YqeY domain-containing protein [Burkholderiales bacterium]